MNNSGKEEREEQRRKHDLEIDSFSVLILTVNVKYTSMLRSLREAYKIFTNEKNSFSFLCFFNMFSLRFNIEKEKSMYLSSLIRSKI